jgi:hypothetical protein
MGAAQVPAAVKLDLSDGVSPDEATQFNSYRELLFADGEQELQNNVLVDRLVQATDANGDPSVQLDANGDPILDANGNKIPVLVSVSVARRCSPAGALPAVRSFFSRFNPGGTHVGWRPAGIEIDLGNG